MKILAAFLLIMLSALPAMAADGVEGYWLTENKRAVIEIEECDASVCGHIYWIIEGGMQFDEHNDNPELRKTPLCGMKILKDFEKTDAGEWENGTIYKADDGDIYKANMELQDDGTLRVRGYVGIPLLGKTQIWSRVSDDDYETCAAG